MQGHVHKIINPRHHIYTSYIRIYITHTVLARCIVPQGPQTALMGSASRLQPSIQNRCPLPLLSLLLMHSQSNTRTLLPCAWSLCARLRSGSAAVVDAASIACSAERRRVKGSYGVAAYGVAAFDTPRFDPGTTRKWRPQACALALCLEHPRCIHRRCGAMGVRGGAETTVHAS